MEPVQSKRAFDIGEKAAEVGFAHTPRLYLLREVMHLLSAEERSAINDTHSYRVAAMACGLKSERLRMQELETENTAMKKIFDYTIGHKNILGTNWPINTVVNRLSATQWQVLNICNKEATCVMMFARKRDAIGEALHRVRAATGENI